MSHERLALIVGNGVLPIQVLKARIDLGVFTALIAFEGQTPKDIEKYLTHDTPILWVKLGAIGAILAFMKKWQVTAVSMAGGIKRPHIKDLSLDWVGAKWLASLSPYFLKGDDALLSAVVDMLLNEGYTVVGAHQFLNDLFLRKGVYTSIVPSDVDMLDIQKGARILQHMSCYDIGQSIVICEGQVLGIEAYEGTKTLIERTGQYARENNLPKPLLIKIQKVGQNQCVDLPTIGLDTMEQLIQHGFKGVALQAGAVQVLDQDKVIFMGNENHILIYAFDND